MVKFSIVTFRWFRTLVGISESVTLHSTNNIEWPNTIDLIWNAQRRVYESSPVNVPCGKHDTMMNVNGKDYNCKVFTTVPDTFEVHLYLLKDSLGEPLERKKDSKSLFNLWSPSYVSVDCESNRFFMQNYSPLALLHESNSSPVISKDITKPVDSYSSNDSGTLNLAEDWKESLNMSTEKCDLECVVEASNSNIELDVNNLTVEELGQKVQNEDATYVLRLLESMKATRKELQVACRKNKELQSDVIKLRDDNVKLLKLLGSNSKLTTKTSDLSFSEQASESTQYQLLPSSMNNIFTSKSLPTLSVTEEEANLPRRFASFENTTLSPNHMFNFSMNDGNFCGKVGSSAQTDITAIGDSPKYYKRNENGIDPNYTLSSQSLDFLTDKTRFSGEDDVSLDTEQILQEAEYFVVKALGNLKSPNYSFHHSETIKMHNTSFINDSFKSKTHIDDKGKRKKLRPFLPKSAKDLRPGHLVKYFGTNGKIQRGKVDYLSLISGEPNLVIAIEELDETDVVKSCSPRRTFVSPKKVILAWEEWS